MSGGFTNDIIGGDATLIRAAIQSPNFNLKNQTGWAIMRDGSAYFFNLTAAGAVTAHSVVIEGSGDGLFIYNGTPGPGRLLLAAAAAAGTDQFGNPYSGPGIAVTGPAGSNEIQIRPDLNAILIYGN